MKKAESVSDGLKLGMRQFASGVCVINTTAPDGQRAAMTASSVTSVSNDPPSLLVCVNTAARLDTLLKQSDYFCVNVLSEEQQVASEVCANPEKSDQRFDLAEWQPIAESGLDYLSNSLSVFVCRKQQIIPYGTHSIVLADIEQVMVSETQKSALVYINGGYHKL